MLRLIAAVALAALPIVAQAAPGRCLLRVEGTTYLQGTCNVLTHPDGSFSIGMIEEVTPDTPSLPPFFATTSRETDGRIVGYWNAVKGSTHAQTPLGTLRRNGACWENASASICAWKQ